MTEHEAAMTMVLEQFCRPGQTVCDPVMLDRAGTALAARRLGRTFDGGSEMQSSIDRIRVRMARRRTSGETHWPMAGTRGGPPRPDGAPAVRMCRTCPPESGSLARIRRSHDMEGPGGAGKPTGVSLDTQPWPIRWTTPLLMGRFKLAAVKSKRIPDPGVWSQFRRAAYPASAWSGTWKSPDAWLPPPALLLGGCYRLCKSERNRC